MWRKDVKTKAGLKLSNLEINNKSKYISLMLKMVFEKKTVVIKFNSPYIFEQNSIA